MFLVSLVWAIAKRSRDAAFLAAGSAIAAALLAHYQPTPSIHTFGPLVATGSFLGILCIRREGMRRGFDPEVLTSLAVEILLVGVAGSRVLFILITPEAFPRTASDGTPYTFVQMILQYVSLWKGGLVWYGGLLPAIPFGMLRMRQLGLPVRTVSDIIAPAIMLGLSIGRIGCLMAGDDHGKVCQTGEHWWTITFDFTDADRLAGKERPLVTPELLGKPLWPAQPLMSIGAFTIFAICHLSRKKLATRPLAVFYIMMTLYPIHRFFIETIRGDVVRKFVRDWLSDPETGELSQSFSWVPERVLGLSTSQAISIPIVAVALLLFLKKLLGRAEEIEKAPPEAAWPPVPAAPAPAPPGEKPAGSAPAAPVAAAPPASPAPDAGKPS
ncbi:prolipoprotein diacylglyceryl transferase [bacterium]|nr:prolipoprotein diacylglyceryl transferase [bacterium]